MGLRLAGIFASSFLIPQNGKINAAGSLFTPPSLFRPSFVFLRFSFVLMR